MKVRQLMTRRVYSVRPMDSVEEAVQLFHRRGIRHLLVMDKAELVGIISDRDINRALEPGATKKRVMALGGLFFLLEPVLVEEIMTGNPVTISPEATVFEAARQLVDHHFGALPVVVGKKVVGIITETDLLRYFAALEMPPKATARKTAPRRRKTSR